MYFFKQLTSYLPSSLTPSTTYFTRASFGALAAYTATMNPILGVLVLLGHGAWEIAGTLMQETIDLQQRRIDSYNREFSTLLQRAQDLGTECTEDEIQRAKNIFFIHNLIEEICYDALVKAVVELGINSDSITEEQSGVILAKVKDAAHLELRKEGGYTKKGREIITPAQFDGVIANLAHIIHDRDGRLTDARYTSLTDLCTALDDHNNYVKNTLFKSWFRCQSLSSDTHLPMIKSLVLFNERMTAQLGFDFKQRLQQTQRYYDEQHHNIRQVVCSRSGERSALRFVNVTEVRGIFPEETIRKLTHSDSSSSLSETLISDCSFTEEQVRSLTQERSVSCPPRFGIGVHSKQITQPPLLKHGISVGEFLETYYPEQLHTQTGCSM